MIEMLGVNKTFNSSDGARIHALNDVSLSVDDGSWLNVVGPNGSGKSTMLKMIAGELSTDSGTILIDGDDVLSWPQSKRANFIQYIEADTLANLVPSMTIEENLALSLNGSGFPGLTFTYRATHRDRIRTCLAAFGMDLENRLRTQIRFLSSGERQAVVVAKTLLRDVQILLLDEFTGALDPAMAPKLLDIVKKVAAANGMSVLMVTHDLDLVERTLEKIAFLKKGKVYAMLEAGEHSRSDLIELYQVALDHSRVNEKPE